MFEIQEYTMVGSHRYQHDGLTLATQEAQGFLEGRSFSGGSSVEGIRTYFSRPAVIINQTDEDVLVNSGYSTVANGYAADIWCPAGKSLVRVSNGGPSDFAVWQVRTEQNARATARANYWHPVVIRKGDNSLLIQEEQKQDGDEEACCVTCGYPVSQCACGEQATCPVCHKAYVFCTCSSEEGEK